jgi:transketolase
LTRDPVPILYNDDFPFEIGKGVVVRDGNDITPVAAEGLAQQGIEARVIDCHTLKPLDQETILRAAYETGGIVTAEYNIIFGGLGSAVAELLVENYPIPMKRIGMPDTFAESGLYQDVLTKYGLSTPHILQAALGVFQRKCRG